MEFSEYIKTPKIQDVILEEQGKSPINGTACLTGHHLILYSHNNENKELWIAHKNVDAVEKRINPEKAVLVLKCKDFKQYYLTIMDPDEALNVCNSVEALSHVASPSMHYPFFYRLKFKVESDGYDLFSTELQFNAIKAVSDEWRISNVNLHFGACKSYPSQVIVPQSIQDSELIKSAKFRQGGRFPVLSYVHNNGRVMLRCSQPLVGQSNKRCKEDERLANAFLGVNHRGYVLDTRTNQTAMQAKSKGGGCETDVYYPQWRKIYHGLSKYNVLQESLIRFVEACTDGSSNSEKWQSKLESSNWTSNVKEVLASSCLVAQCIDKEGASVMVHGSQGIDCTLQVTSLAQVVLDSNCRTIHGFLALIDKDWIQAGHPFAERCFHSAFCNQRLRYEGPVFTVFLEAVFQLQHQFPLSFEFTSSLLVELNRHAYSSEFGTFLCNNEMERRQHKVRTKTVSLWSYLLSDNVLPRFLNPLYQRRETPVWPSIAPQSLVIWDGLFLPNIDSSSASEKIIKNTLSEIEQLQDELACLSHEVSELQELKSVKDSIKTELDAVQA